MTRPATCVLSATGRRAVAASADVLKLLSACSLLQTPAGIAGMLVAIPITTRRGTP